MVCSPDYTLSSVKFQNCILTIKTQLMCMCVCVYIYIYICNELIEETSRHRKLIFGMFGSFGYSSTKF